MQNQSTPSVAVPVVRDSDPLVGSVYGIYRSAVCVRVLKRIEKPIKTQCFSRFGSKRNEKLAGCVYGIYRSFKV